MALFKLASGLSASIEVHRRYRRWLFVPMATCDVFHTLEPSMHSHQHLSVPMQSARKPSFRGWRRGNSVEPEHVRCNSHSPLHINLLRPLGSWPPQLRLFPSNSAALLQWVWMFFS
jgi:hypothetical protein